MRSILITAGLMTVGLVALPAKAVLAADTSTLDGKELTDFALSGLKDGRQRLRSGVFRASGHRESELDDGTSVKQEYEVFCAFDFDRRLFRFDHLGTMSTSASNEKKPCGGKYVRTREKVIHWIVDSRQAVIYPPEKLPIATMKPFDVRVIGLADHATLDHEGGPGWDEFVAYYQPSKCSVSQETPSLYELSYLSGGEFRFELTLDANQGFSPVRQQAFRPDSDGEFSVLRETDLTTWTEKNGVWVPTSLSMDVGLWNIRRCELSFEWESVNEPVDESLFTWEGMQLAKGTRIRDVRLGGVGIFVASVGEYRAPQVLKPEELGGARGWRTGIIVLNVAIFLVVVLVVLWRRRAATRAIQ